MLLELVGSKDSCFPVNGIVCSNKETREVLYARFSKELGVTLELRHNAEHLQAFRILVIIGCIYVSVSEALIPLYFEFSQFCLKVAFMNICSQKYFKIPFCKNRKCFQTTVGAWKRCRLQFTDTRMMQREGLD